MSMISPQPTARRKAFHGPTASLPATTVSAEAFGHPDRDIPVVGMTGTKGKSTVAYMLRAILDAGSISRVSVIMPSSGA